MDNLDFGNIAIATVIIGFLNLVIVVLTKTETILKIVERIKGVVGFDYKGRAKKSADEIRMMKRRSEEARERVRHSFIHMKKWGCIWTWNWSEDLVPINIKGFCTGKRAYSSNACNYLVYGYYHFPDKSENSNLATIGISCTNNERLSHRPIRAEFEVFMMETEGKTAEEALNAILSKTILAERDFVIAEEIKKLQKKFWR